MATREQIEEFRKAMETQNLDFEKKYNEQRFDELKELYTDDCVLMMPGEPAATGNKDIPSEMKKLYDEGVVKMDIVSLELKGPYITPCGMEGMERSKVICYDKDNKIKYKGKAVDLLVYKDGKWKIYWDMLNYDNGV